MSDTNNPKPCLPGCRDWNANYGSIRIHAPGCPNAEAAKAEPCRLPEPCELHPRVINSTPAPVEKAGEVDFEAADQCAEVWKAPDAPTKSAPCPTLSMAVWMPYPKPCLRKCRLFPDVPPTIVHAPGCPNAEAAKPAPAPAPAPVEKAGICHHGGLRRSCETCDCDDQITALRAEVEGLRAERAVLVDQLATERSARKKARNQLATERSARKKAEAEVRSLLRTW